MNTNFQNIYAIGDIHGDIKSLIVCLRDLSKVIKKNKLLDGRTDDFSIEEIIKDDHERLLMPIDHELYDPSLGYNWIDDEKLAISTGDLIDNKRDGDYYDNACIFTCDRNLQTTTITRKDKEGNFTIIQEIPYDYGRYYVGLYDELKNYQVYCAKPEYSGKQLNYQRYYINNITPRGSEIIPLHTIFGYDEHGTEIQLDNLTDDVRKFTIKGMKIGFDEYIHEELKIIKLLNSFKNVIKIFGNHEYNNIKAFWDTTYGIYKPDSSSIGNIPESLKISEEPIYDEINKLIIKTHVRTLYAEAYVSDFALSMAYIEPNSSEVIPRQCVFFYNKMGYLELVKNSELFYVAEPHNNPLSLFKYKNFCLLHGGLSESIMAKIAAHINSSFRFADFGSMTSSDKVDIINIDFKNDLNTIIYDRNKQIYDETIHAFIVNDRTFGRVYSSDCARLKNTLKLLSNSGDIVDTMIIGHCPQYFENTSEYGWVSSEFYTIFSEMNKPDDISEEFIPPAFNKNKYFHAHGWQSDELGITTGCQLNDSDDDTQKHGIYRIDVGMSRAFDALNGNCTHSAKFLDRRPQVLNIQFIGDDYKVKIIKTNVENMNKNMNRLHCGGSNSLKNMLKFIKYFNKNLIL